MMTSNDKLTTEQQFERYHDKLRRELNIASWHFRVIEYISEIQQNYTQELNQAPAFFGLTINAHLYATLTRLNNFFGKRGIKEHLHMKSFLDFVKENKAIFSKKAFEKRLRKAGRYDKLAAQFDSEITTEKVEIDRQKIGKITHF